MFIFIVFLGFSRERAYLSWIILEVRTALFIFFLFRGKLRSVGNLVHYYLIQAFRRVGLFFRILFMLNGGEFFQRLFLLIKLGIFPFHYWYLGLLAKLEYILGLVLIRPRKLILLGIFFNLEGKLTIWVRVRTILYSTLVTLYEKNLKILLGLSSLFNLAWVFATIGLGDLWLGYFLIYRLNLVFIIFRLESFNNFYSSNNLIFQNFFCLLFFCLLLFFSLGLPPFISFFSKIYFLVYTNEYLFLGGLLIIRRILFIYIYLRFIFHRLRGLGGEFKWVWGGEIKTTFRVIFISNLLCVLLFSIWYYLNNT